MKELIKGPIARAKRSHASPDSAVGMLDVPVGERAGGEDLAGAGGHLE